MRFLIISFFTLFLISCGESFDPTAEYPEDQKNFLEDITELKALTLEMKEFARDGKTRDADETKELIKIAYGEYGRWATNTYEPWWQHHGYGLEITEDRSIKNWVCYVSPSPAHYLIYSDLCVVPYDNKFLEIRFDNQNTRDITMPRFAKVQSGDKIKISGYFFQGADGNGWDLPLNLSSDQGKNIIMRVQDIDSLIILEENAVEINVRINDINYNN